MLPLGARVRALVLVLLVAGASAFVAGGPVLGFSGGISEKIEKEGGGTVTLLAGGCSCHNPSLEGDVQTVLEGVPSFWTNLAGDQVLAGPYPLTIRFSGGPEPRDGRAQGGFNLQATAGTFKVPAGAQDVQVTEDGQATHTPAGTRQRNWTIHWEPPTQAGPDVVFTLTVNSVNGNGANDPGDRWGRASIISMGKAAHLAQGASTAGGAGGAAHGEGGATIAQISKLGVNFYAYWIGVVSFVVLFVVLAATFFLLRYGESRHWTDQRARPAREKDEAPKSATGTWIVLGLVALAFLVAAVQIVRVV